MRVTGRASLERSFLTQGMGRIPPLAVMTAASGGRDDPRAQLAAAQST